MKLRDEKNLNHFARTVFINRHLRRIDGCRGGTAVEREMAIFDLKASICRAFKAHPKADKDKLFKLIWDECRKVNHDA